MAMNHLLRSPSSRNERSIVKAMNRDVQAGGIVVKNLLDSVTMVNILNHEVIVRKQSHCHTRAYVHIGYTPSPLLPLSCSWRPWPWLPGQYYWSSRMPWGNEEKRKHGVKIEGMILGWWYSRMVVQNLPCLYTCKCYANGQQALQIGVSHIAWLGSAWWPGGRTRAKPF